MLPSGLCFNSQELSCYWTSPSGIYTVSLHDKHSSSAFFASLIPPCFLDLNFMDSLVCPLMVVLGVPFICIYSSLSCLRHSLTMIWSSYLVHNWCSPKHINSLRKGHDFIHSPPSSLLIPGMYLILFWEMNTYFYNLCLILRTRTELGTCNALFCLIFIRILLNFNNYHSKMRQRASVLCRKKNPNADR